MGATGSVHANMQVYGPDGQLVGMVDGGPGSRLQVGGRYMLPLSMVIRRSSRLAARKPHLSNLHQGGRCHRR